jgi:hypothetical protein
VGATAVTTALFVPGCIDVGHPAEIGCLVDMTEPGCVPGSGDASAIDATRDSVFRSDAGQDDGAMEAQAASGEADSDAGALPIIDAPDDGPTDASSDGPVTDARGDVTPGD